jgi:hypothetical protein
MRHAQVLIYEADGRIQQQLRELWDKRKWAVRPVPRLESCLRLVQGGGPTVLVLKLGQLKPGKAEERPEQRAARLARRHAAELTLLEQITWLVPDIAVVAIGEPGNGALAGLAWDLGAAHVNWASSQPGQLEEVVSGLMEGALTRFRAGAGRGVEPTARIEPEASAES